MIIPDSRGDVALLVSWVASTVYLLIRDQWRVLAKSRYQDASHINPPLQCIDQDWDDRHDRPRQVWSTTRLSALSRLDGHEMDICGTDKAVPGFYTILYIIYHILLYTRLPGQRSVQWLTTPSQSTFQVKQTVRIETFEFLNSILMALMDLSQRRIK